MEILRLVKHEGQPGRYSAVFNIIPELTYEKIGHDYVGSSVNANGDIVASHWLKKESYGNAFGGRVIELKMKDGTTKDVKDYWFDHGSYPDHGSCRSIGAETLEGLQRCYVYFGYNINTDTFQKMVDEYLKHDKVYGYWETEDWCKLQHTWHDVIVHGKKIPFMMNKYGDMVEKEEKKRVFARHNVARQINGVFRTHTYFRFNYEEDGRLIKIDANYLETLKATLPQSEEEIRRNNEMPSIEEEKQIMFFCKNGRKPWEFKQCDILNVNDEFLEVERVHGNTIYFSSFDDWVELDEMKHNIDVVCFAKDRKDIGGV